MNILVSGAGSLIGQGIIRSLKISKLKYNLFTADYFPESVGLYWSKNSFIFPDLLNKNIKYQIWLENLINLIKNNKIDLLIPGVDFEIPILSKYKKIIEKKTKVLILVSPKNVVNIGNDKWKTFLFLKKNNFNCPNSTKPDNIKNFLKKNNFPLIVKPRFGHTSKNLFLVKNNKELKVVIKKINKPIIQEYLKSEDNEFTCSTTFVKDKIVSTISLKRILKNGNTSVAFFNNYRSIDNYINNVTKKLKPFGPTNFQLRLTDKGPSIFEINPRFSGTTPIRAQFGINEVEAIINAIFYDNFKNKFKLKKGVIIRYTDDQFVNWKKYKSF